VYHCQWFPCLLFLEFVCQACLTFSSVLLPSNDGGVTGQASAHLVIATQLARELGNQIGYYL